MLTYSGSDLLISVGSSQTAVASSSHKGKPVSVTFFTICASGVPDLVISFSSLALSSVAVDGSAGTITICFQGARKAILAASGSQRKLNSRRGVLMYSRANCSADLEGSI